MAQQNKPVALNDLLSSRLATAKRNSGGRQAFTADNFDSWQRAKALEDQKAVALQAERERKDRMIRQLMHRSGVQDIFLNASLENYAIYSPGQHQAIQCCRQFLADFGQFGATRNMLFAGSTGTGKNHMASAICNALIASGRSAVVATAMEIQMRVRASRRNGSELTEEQAMYSFADMDLLVIDEIELGSNQDYDAKIVNAVIDRRAVRRKSTIVLTNMALHEFAAFAGDRINDRLGESMYLVECMWPSYRTNKTALQRGEQ